MARIPEFFERVANAPVVTPQLPLVVLLTGFTDAGGTVSAVVDFAREDLQPEPVAMFHNDALLDYRARRPIVTFDRDHLSDYRPPRLELSLAHDALGQPFLLLMGYEPDFAWDGFAAAVLALADEFDVSTMTWVHAIAMPVPHTRALTTTVSGSRHDLIQAHSVWKPHTEAPATAGHLLEMRMSEDGFPVAGFVMLVPHYLAETVYPGAAIAALDRLMTATGLVFGLDSLREDNRAYLERVGEQIERNDELAQMVQALERRFDAYMAGERDGTPRSGGFVEGDLPSADELAAELERFLADRPADDERGA
ncbi:proteasome assembly chaperone family protein [Microbacterium sp. ZXX196]|uniref:proteasome assembly chaperone family protein n=1 Tax=Microbacterium sp. ZXX196 TaxID=2609291 RepID=UPI0012B868DC|nr:PAC2 family protein [Microbacterium sp. ZXX196]MTE24100.1 PAC2 family protein [Microbacterium sp. ZXX196]